MEVGARVVTTKACFQVKPGWFGTVKEVNKDNVLIHTDDQKMFWMPMDRVRYACTKKSFYNRYDLLDLIYAIKEYGVDIMKEEIEHCQKVNGTRVKDGILYHN